MITTKDRRDELAEVLPTALAQTAPVEVLVIDDGSSDGTAEMVRAHFPEVRVDRSERSLGLIAQRTRAARLARAPIVVSIDDDARFVSPDTVAQTLRDFDHPRIGAVAIPLVDIREGEVRRQFPPDDVGRWITPSFIGTAHAVRRDVFASLGGYRSMLRQMGEEPDYCLRMLAAGYVTRLGRAEPIHHHESPRRNVTRIIQLMARNEILHGWHNVPWPYLPVRWAKVTAYTLLLGLRLHRIGAVVSGLTQGLLDSVGRSQGREPVPRSVYRLDHDLRRQGPLPLDVVLTRLPVVSQSTLAKSSA